MRMPIWQQRVLATAREYYVLIIFASVGSIVAAKSYSLLAVRMSQIPRYQSESLAVQKFTVVINTWKRHKLLEKSVAHYARCDKVDALRVVWSESKSPPRALTTSIERRLKDEEGVSGRDPRLHFDIRSDRSLNSRFLPLPDLNTTAVLSVDDDLLINCDSVLFAFKVWQIAPDAMVGFHPRMHLVSKLVEGRPWYKYGGWFSVWWTRSYSMVLTKACFIHRKYLEAYSIKMPEMVRDYVRNNRNKCKAVTCIRVTKTALVCQDVDYDHDRSDNLDDRNCEDIAMSFLVANMTCAPPIWVRGKVRDFGKIGLSSQKEHEEKRSMCLNDFVKLFGWMPLVARHISVAQLRNWLF